MYHVQKRMRVGRVTRCDHSNRSTKINMPEPEATEKGPVGGNKLEHKDVVEGVKSSGSRKVPPPGVVPLFFSGPSQQIFGCVVDVDLTDQNPHKLIPKQKIIEDFKNRAAVCDFHPVKQKMLVHVYTCTCK